MRHVFGAFFLSSRCYGWEYRANHHFLRRRALQLWCVDGDYLFRTWTHMRRAFAGERIERALRSWFLGARSASWRRA